MHRKTKIPARTSIAQSMLRSIECIVYPCVVCLLTVCGGCSDGRCPVTGSVTFNAVPVQEGLISLEPADGNGPTVGGKIIAGEYALTGQAAPLPGKKLVRVIAARKTGRRVPAGPPTPPGTMIDEVYRYIPAAYNARSTLTCEISRDGTRQIDFNLKTP